MTQIRLTRDEMAAVRDIVTGTSGAAHLRRALAILWLHHGDTPRAVAERLCVSRATVYNWVTRFRDRASLDAAARIADAPRSGRPRAAGMDSERRYP